LHEFINLSGGLGLGFGCRQLIVMYCLKIRQYTFGDRNALDPTKVPNKPKDSKYLKCLQYAIIPLKAPSRNFYYAIQHLNIL